MYFRLTIDLAGMSQYWEFLNNEDLRLAQGLPLDVEEDDVELPFRLQVSYHPDLDGKAKVQPLYDYVSNVKVMSKRLVSAIQEAGVDNLQALPAVVTNSATGSASEDYVVVNVVGMVAAANLARSVGSPIANAVYFDKVAVEASKARGLLLFRIKESPIDIIIHEAVAQRISAGNFQGVILEPA